MGPPIPATGEKCPFCPAWRSRRELLELHVLAAHQSQGAEAWVRRSLQRRLRSNGGVACRAFTRGRGGLAFYIPKRVALALGWRTGTPLQLRLGHDHVRVERAP